MGPESFDVYPPGWRDPRPFDERLTELSKEPPAALISWLIEYFQSRQPPPPITRKPSLRFRTHYGDRRIEIAPQWQASRQERKRILSMISGQLSFSTHSWHDGRQHWEPVLEVRWLPIGAFRLSRRPKDIPKAVAELETLAGFFTLVGRDPEGTIATGARGACGLCGKALTDPESIRRGIGPECYRSLVKANAVISSFQSPEAL
jgi:hypothetical protein